MTGDATRPTRSKRITRRDKVRASPPTHPPLPCSAFSSSLTQISVPLPLQRHRPTCSRPCLSGLRSSCPRFDRVERPRRPPRSTRPPARPTSSPSPRARSASPRERPPSPAPDGSRFSGDSLSISRTSLLLPVECHCSIPSSPCLSPVCPPAGIPRSLRFVAARLASLLYPCHDLLFTSSLSNVPLHWVRVERKEQSRLNRTGRYRDVGLSKTLWRRVGTERSMLVRVSNTRKQERWTPARQGEALDKEGTKQAIESEECPGGKRRHGKGYAGGRRCSETEKEGK